jgi:hypothetical protein
MCSPGSVGCGERLAGDHGIRVRAGWVFMSSGAHGIRGAKGGTSRPDRVALVQVRRPDHHPPRRSSATSPGAAGRSAGSDRLRAAQTVDPRASLFVPSSEVSRCARPGNGSNLSTTERHERLLCQSSGPEIPARAAGRVRPTPHSSDAPQLSVVERVTIALLGHYLKRT